MKAAADAILNRPIPCGSFWTIPCRGRNDDFCHCRKNDSCRGSAKIVSFAAAWQNSFRPHGWIQAKNLMNVSLLHARVLSKVYLLAGCCA